MEHIDRKSHIEQIMKKSIVDLIRLDNIDLSQKGFTRKHHFRSIYIYYVFEENIVVIEGELSGDRKYDFLIYAEYKHLKYSYNPLTNTFKELSFEDKQNIQANLIEWLSQEHIKNDIKAGV